MPKHREATILGRVLLVLLPLFLIVPPPGRCEETLGRVSIPLVGLQGVDLSADAHHDAGRLARLGGLGPALVATGAVAWGMVEPHDPAGIGGRHLYDWEALDRFVSHWQAAGFEPVLVLSPASPWASSDAAEAEWPRRIREALPEAEASVLLRGATGARPPRDRAWGHWEAFVQSVAERYDRDGTDDMEGLLRPVGWIQVIDRPTSPAAWVGSGQDYLRLLHHAREGAHRASKAVRIAHGTLDLDTLGEDPLPAEKELAGRLKARHVHAPMGLLLEGLRAIEFARLTLSLDGVYRSVSHAGSGHLADEAVDLRLLRHIVDAGAGPSTELWLVDTPAAKIEATALATVRGPTAEEHRVRSRGRGAARRATPDGEGSAATEAARAWWEAGQAYDVVRTLAAARAAGADRVFFGGADSLDTFVRGTPEGGWRRTPAWYALRQANTHVTGHVRIEESPLGSSARAWRFEFPKGHHPPWVLAVAMEPDWSWAGRPGAAHPTHEVAIPLRAGPYVVEAIATDASEPAKERHRSSGTLRLSLTPAPIWIYPDV